MESIVRQFKRKTNFMQRSEMIGPVDLVILCIKATVTLQNDEFLLIRIRKRLSVEAFHDEGRSVCRSHSATQTLEPIKVAMFVHYSCALSHTQNTCKLSHNNLFNMSLIIIIVIITFWGCCMHLYSRGCGNFLSWEPELYFSVPWPKSNNLLGEWIHIFIFKLSVIVTVL